MIFGRAANNKLVLGLCSATDNLEVALVENSRLLVEYSSSADRRAENLMKHVDWVFAECGRQLKELSAVAVIIGPGSYGGLRGGIAAAKGLSQTLNVPLIGIPTLDVVSGNMDDARGLIIIALPARKNEYSIGVFGGSGEGIKRLTGDFSATDDAVAGALARVASEAYLVSTHAEIFSKIKRLNPETEIEFFDDARAVPHARTLARIGVDRLSRGDVSDPLSLIPQYSHEPNIREYEGDKGEKL
jgi:tRNA threonylcarbamoyladenosine biosynthesis protein TsaB